MFLKSDTQQANQHFSRVPSIAKPRNAFGISATHKTTIQFDKIYPIYHKFIMPGDTISITHALIARLGTQISVLHDDLYFDMHAWYVPMRLIQTNFNRFYWNEKVTGPSQDNSALTTPSIPSGIDGTSATGLASKSIYDYFGYPTLVRNTAGTHYINNYLPRAYNKIHIDHYMDQNLQTPVVLDLDDGEDAIADYNILKRGKRFDKFTSCLTSLQKGTASTLSVGTSAPVLTSSLDPTFNKTGIGGARTLTADAVTNVISLNGAPIGGAGGAPINFHTESGLYTDLTNVVGATVNAFRRSIAIQHILETDSRGGTRAIEASQNRFGVAPNDQTLQRSEYLGGMTFSFDGKIVPQTSSTTGTHYQGDLAQFSECMNQFNVSHSFTEWGIFMILISARSNITYQEGLARELSYRTRYDFYQPEFANIGDVAVLQQEIYYGGVAADYNTVFGYLEYGYEMRYEENRVSGEFRSNYPTSRDYKHCADDNSSAPTLSTAFIQSNTRITTNLAVAPSAADPIEISALTQGKIARVMPMYSIPGLTRI